MFRLHFSPLPFTEAISYGRTVERYITKEAGYLSYPASAIVMVFSKQAGYGGDGDEYWEAEVRGGEGRLGRVVEGLVMVFSKQAGYGGDGDEYWEAEVRGGEGRLGRVVEGLVMGVLQAGGVWW